MRGKPGKELTGMQGEGKGKREHAGIQILLWLERLIAPRPPNRKG